MIILSLQLSSYCPLLPMTHLPFVIHHVPDDLEMSQVIVAQQLVLLSGVEQREVLHNDGCSSRDTAVLTYLNTSTEKCHWYAAWRLQLKLNESCKCILKLHEITASASE